MAPNRSPVSAIVSESEEDAAIPGVVVELDPHQAERLGAFEEDALDEATAWEANADLHDPVTAKLPAAWRHF
jgi:hypothetical protein